MKEKKGNTPVSKVVENSITYDATGKETGRRSVERCFEYNDKASDSEVLFYTLMYLLAGIGIGLMTARISSFLS